MVGTYYLLLMVGIFVAIGGVIALFAGLLYFGHWLDRRSGAKHGFLELPREFRTDTGPADAATEGGGEGGAEQQA
jgi:hypothetical protein